MDENHRAAMQRQLKVQLFARCLVIALLGYGALMQFSESKTFRGVLLSILCALVAFSTWTRYRAKGVSG